MLSKNAENDRAPIIAIEGLDGTGKTTIVELLAQRMDALVIRNPPSTLASQRAEADALEPNQRRAWYLNANRVAMEEALEAAKSGKPVVLDRSVASTLCFGAAEQGRTAKNDDIPDWLPLPDAIVLLSLLEAERRQRHQRRGDTKTFEERRLAADDAFRERVLIGYRCLCTHEVDASASPVEVVEQILRAVGS